MTTLDDLRRASSAFDLRLSGVAADQWTAPTPCDAWTVRDLVDHVTGGNRFAVALLDGATTAEALDAALAPGFGDDVIGEYRTSAEAQLAAFATDDAAGRICRHPAGDITGAVFAGFRVGDIAVHTWDLARSVGGDEHLGDDLVGAAWAVMSARGDALAASGVYGSGSSGSLSEGAPLQHRLLDLAGRRA